MTPVMAFYQNQGSEPILLGIGSLPGKPWTRYDSQPGQVIQGPAGYADKFTAAGYALITAEEAELARLYAEEAEVKAKAEAEAALEAERKRAADEAEAARVKAEAEAEAARIAAMPGPAPVVQEQKAPERKGRRADRGPTGTG